MQEHATSPTDQAAGGAPTSSQSKSNPAAPPMAMPSVPPRLALIYALLCVLGVAVSVELLRIHVFVHTDPAYHSVCAMSEGVNCETVALSPYAVFAGVPVAVWGIGGYLLMGVLACSGLGKRRLHAAWPWGLLLALTGFSVLASAILAYISATQIASLCLFCLCSYAITAALMVLALTAARKSRARLSDLVLLDVKALVRHPLLAMAASIVIMAMLLGLALLMPRYWKAPGWQDLPPLPSGLDADGHPWIGASHPRLTIVEFSDYECPHCRKAHKSVRLLAAKHPDQVRLIHRHLPLDQACHPGIRAPFHTHACRFAEAAECAGAQGRFWEMNDALFSIQDKVKAKNVDPMDLAVRIGLSRAQFKRCMDDHASAPRIARDIEASMTRRLSGTPTFVIADEVLPGWVSESDLEQRLRSTP
jgi:protein-disulfide isomerase/uncharacterized membrane protein